LKNSFRPYYVHDQTIFFTDGVADLVICIDIQKLSSESINTLLNDAYNTAYQDGLSAALNKHHKDLIDKLKKLSTENSRLKHQLEKNEKK
jgi:hypothetical protein